MTIYYKEENNMANIIAVENGWKCPQCHKIWAPTIKSCVDCNPPQNESLTPSTVKLLLEDK